jgi:hypothetical protein
MSFARLFWFTCILIYAFLSVRNEPKTEILIVACVGIFCDLMTILGLCFKKGRILLMTSLVIPEYFMLPVYLIFLIVIPSKT